MRAWAPAARQSFRTPRDEALRRRREPTSARLARCLCSRRCSLTLHAAVRGGMAAPDAPACRGGLGRFARARVGHDTVPHGGRGGEKEPLTGGDDAPRRRRIRSRPISIEWFIDGSKWVTPFCLAYLTRAVRCVNGACRMICAQRDRDWSFDHRGNCLQRVSNLPWQTPRHASGNAGRARSTAADAVLHWSRNGVA